MKRLAIILILALGSTPVIAPVAAWAVQPDEILSDPKLEERARDLSKGLRCLVCRNESIDESNAELAKDLRVFVRERLVEGDSDEEVIDSVVDRFGEYVLLKPTFNGSNWLLWASGPLVLLLAGGMGWGYLRGRANAPNVQEAGLSDAEQERLRKILEH